MLATRDGMAIRFPEKTVRRMGRSAHGVRGIRLEKDDRLVGLILADEKTTVLTVCENGYGKRTAVGEYRLTNRGGKGVINIKTTERNGKVIAVVEAHDDDEMMIMTERGMVIRCPMANVRTIGRNTQGVRVITLDEGDRAVVVARLAKEDAVSADEAAPNAEPGPASSPRSSRPLPEETAPEAESPEPKEPDEEAGMLRPVNLIFARQLEELENDGLLLRQAFPDHGRGRIVPGRAERPPPGRAAGTAHHRGGNLLRPAPAQARPGRTRFAAARAGHPDPLQRRQRGRHDAGIREPEPDQRHAAGDPHPEPRPALRAHRAVPLDEPHAAAGPRLVRLVHEVRPLRRRDRRRLLQRALHRHDRRRRRGRQTHPPQARHRGLRLRERGRRRARAGDAARPDPRRRSPRSSGCAATTTCSSS